MDEEPLQEVPIKVSPIPALLRTLRAQSNVGLRVLHGCLRVPVNPSTERIHS